MKNPMHPIRLETVDELRAWVLFKMGSDAKDKDIEAVLKFIQNDCERPDWGADWRPYFVQLDLWAITDD